MVVRGLPAARLDCFPIISHQKGVDGQGKPHPPCQNTVFQGTAVSDTAPDPLPAEIGPSPPLPVVSVASAQTWGGGRSWVSVTSTWSDEDKSLFLLSSPRCTIGSDKRSK